MAERAKADQFTKGLWWRFDRYEVNNGYIRPGKNARLHQYNPWEMYSRSKTQSRANPPYQSLLELLARLGADSSIGNPCRAVGVVPETEEYDLASRGVLSSDAPSFGSWAEAAASEKNIRYSVGLDGLRKTRRRIRRLIPRAGIGLTPLEVCGNVFEPGYQDLAVLRKLAPLPADAADLISDWCSEYGLLGVLPHTAESIRLSARWTRGDPFNPELRFMAETLEHYRSNGQWLTRVIQCKVDEDVELGPRKEGWPLPPSPAYSPRCPAARIRHFDKNLLDLPGLHEEGLHETWCDFFPGIARRQQSTFEYPRPLSDWFWEIYAEPLEAFLEHALTLWLAINLNLNFEALLEPLGIGLTSTQGGDVAECWNCPSLLSAFAKMAAQDLATGLRVLRCPACCRPFVSSAYQAVYCSEVCGWRDRKRRARRGRNDRG